ncbi:MAG: alpha/beta hydrolase [Bacteroidota bacterium]
MATIQFSHANGMPAKSYSFFFQQFESQSFQYVDAFGIHNQGFHSWYELRDELIADIEKRNNAPIVGMGHSLGAVLTLWAAMKRPDLFSKVIMLDPPLFEKRVRRFLKYLGPLGISEYLVPIAKNARRRRDNFETIQDAFDYWSPKPFFKRFHPSCFKDYVDHSLVQKEDGTYTLFIPKALEARIFGRTASEIGFKKGKVPVYWVYPENSVVKKEVIEEYEKQFPEITFIKVEGGHMFPLEKPVETAQLLTKLIDKTE